MKSEEVLAYCLTKHGCVETYPFGESPICMKVCGKVFAEIYSDEVMPKVTLKCDKELALFYREQYPGLIVRGYHCPPVQQPYRNTVSIKELSDDFILDMIDHSYNEVLKGLSRKVKIEFFGCLTKEQVIAQGALYYENIQDAFGEAEHKMVTGTIEEIRSQLKKLQQENGVDSSYVDFYYGALKKEEKERVWDLLSERGRMLLEPYTFLNKLTFLPLQDDLLELTLEMNEKEILFSTYYFIKSNCSIWGNYGNNFPMFFR